MSAKESAINKDSDTLILVDDHDNEIGTCEKVACHLGRGKLHRAFSVFLFDPQGRVLLQQRSAKKMLWGGYWANSCCSHPRSDETTEAAAHRRMMQELGVESKLRYLYKFVYHAEFKDVGSEHEYCWVFAGHFDGKLAINEDEISATRLLTPDELTNQIATNGENYTPWLKLEWERIRNDFLSDLI